MNIGMLEYFTRVSFHVAAGDVGQVDVEAGSHWDGDRQSSSLWPLGGDESSDGGCLRVEDPDVERKSVLVERLKRQRQVAGRRRNSCRYIACQRHVHGLSFVYL